MSLDALIRFLKAHEIELIEVHENASKKSENVVLKSLQKIAKLSFALVAKKESKSEEAFEDEDEDEIVHLVRRMNKLFTKIAKGKKKKKKKNPSGEKKEN